MGVIKDHLDSRANETQREFRGAFVFVCILLFLFFVVSPFFIFNGYKDWREQRDREVKELITQRA